MGKVLKGPQRGGIVRGEKEKKVGFVGVRGMGTRRKGGYKAKGKGLEKETRKK